MHRREREIRRMVADLGMEITSWRTNGNGHWRVDIKTPNGRQRPFTFSTSEGDFRLRKNEETALRRWRREVQPELDMAEEAGALEPPPAARTALAEKLAKAGIPLKIEESPKPGKLATGLEIGGKVARFNDTPRSEPPFKKAGIPISPSAFAPGTPEAALASTITQEPVMQTQQPQPQPQTTSPPGEPERKKHVFTKKREQMSFAEVMKFGVWMNKDRLEGYYTRGDFCDHASHVLGFKVSDDALKQWLDSNGVEMPKRPEPVNKPKNWHEQVNEDLACIALAVSDSIPDGPHRNVLLAIVERRTAANHPKA